jgi:hypothetical protein
MFRKECDFEALERVVVEAHLRRPICIPPKLSSPTNRAYSAGLRYALCHINK